MHMTGVRPPEARVTGGWVLATTRELFSLFALNLFLCPFVSFCPYLSPQTLEINSRPVIISCSAFINPGKSWGYLTLRGGSLWQLQRRTTDWQQPECWSSCPLGSVEAGKPALSIGPSVFETLHRVECKHLRCSYQDFFPFSLYSSGWPGTHCVDHAGPELTEIH